MSETNLSAMTVIELRKLAKELHVPLGAGISKQGIIDKLTPVVNAAAEPEKSEPVAVEPEKSEPAPEKQPEAPAPEQPAAPQQPAFRQAYTAPQRFNTRPAYQAPAYNNRQYPQRTPGTVEPQRTQTTRPVSGFTPRFGPAAHDPQPVSSDEENRTFRSEAPRPAYSAERRPAYQEQSRFQSRPAAEARPAYEQRPAYDQRPSYDQRPTYDQRPAVPRKEAGAPYSDFNTANPGVNELLAAGDCLDGAGTLELHPDGYGFLRNDTFLASSKDIYVSMAQVRRFGLRTGDHVSGKVRPLRDGDKYSAMLYITEVNGIAAETMLSRPAFEELTPVYPNRRLSLECSADEKLHDLRVIDLMTPIGFGQRGLLLCPPEVEKTALLQHMAQAIAANAPDADVFVLLLNENPEDVTLFREQVSCPVLATTFDMPPENHLRLADLVLERAQRLVEAKRDVVLLVDSLTTLSKVYTTAALQQGRQAAGTINPASLNKAKKLFGAARSLREGGSLTILATMNVDNGSKVDDAVVNEFRAAANMCLVLDATLARNGVQPPIDLIFSATRRTDLLLTPAQEEGLTLLRRRLSEQQPQKAMQELLFMLDKASTSEELLSRVKDWITDAMR